MGNSLAIRKVGDRVGEGSEYRNRLWRVTTHMVATAGMRRRGHVKLLCFMWLSLFLKLV
jgi:hypothetical protein